MAWPPYNTAYQRSTSSTSTHEKSERWSGRSRSVKAVAGPAAGRAAGRRRGLVMSLGSSGASGGASGSRRHGSSLSSGGANGGGASGGGASGSRPAVRAAPRPPLVLGIEFFPDTQGPGVPEVEEEGHGSMDFVQDTEDNSGGLGLFPYDSDEVKFVPDSEIGAEDEFVPDSILEDPVGAQDDDYAEEPVDGQLDENEVCYSMLRILCPDYFKIRGNENLGM